MPRSKPSAVMSDLPKRKPANTAKANAMRKETYKRGRKVVTGDDGVRKVVYTMDNLNPMQRAFIDEWAKGETIASAAKRAGYAAPSNMYTLMEFNPSFRALASAARAKNAESLNMTRERVMQGLLEAADMAKLMAEPASMVSAWREIGKMCGFYAPVEHKFRVEGNVTIDKMNRLTDAELLELVKPVQDKISQSLHPDRGAQDVEARPLAVQPALGHDSGAGEDGQEA